LAVAVLLVVLGLGVAAVLFLLREAEPGSVAVVVARPGGRPISGARVVVSDKLSVSDTNGVARVSAVEAGPARVRVSAPGFGDDLREVDVLSGSETQVFITLRDARLIGQLRERAAEPAIPGGVNVTLRTGAGETIRTKSDGRGRFEIDHAPVGAARLEVDAHVEDATTRRFDRYEATPFPIDLKPGLNRRTFLLPISPVETFVRWYTLSMDGRAGAVHRAARLYSHPDARKYGCDVQTVANRDLEAHRQGTYWSDFFITRANRIPTWTHVVEYTGTKAGHAGRARFRYRDVVALTIRTIYSTFSPATTTVHAVKVGGLWKGFPYC
jgi:hypothetical protein